MTALLLRFGGIALAGIGLGEAFHARYLLGAVLLLAGSRSQWSYVGE
jgi:hypothetical protein